MNTEQPLLQEIDLFVVQSLWAAHSPADCCSMIFVVVEYMNSSFWCSLNFLLCRVYDQLLLLQPDLLMVQSLWTVPFAAAWPLIVQSLWTAPPAAAWPFFIVQLCCSPIFVVVQSIRTHASAPVWPSYCADCRVYEQNSRTSWSLTFLLRRVYEQPLLLQPEPSVLVLEAHIHANPKPKVKFT